MLHQSSVSSYLSSNKYPAKSHSKAVAKYLSLTTGTLYLESQKSQLQEDNDHEVPFRQRRHFYYLSGCNLADSYLTYSIHDDKLTLFIPPIDPDEVMWSGLPLSKEGALEKYDVDEVRYSDELEDYLKELKDGEILGIPNQISKHVQTHIKEEQKLKDALDECRVFKDDYEVAMIKHANEISTLAHHALMKAAKSIKNERELEAMFIENCISRGARHQSYSSIVASGKNAATLHYIKNDEPVKGRQNILVDAGCEYENYASDITRVFPLSGTFTPESRSIYSLVLKMQTDAISEMKPGASWDDIHLLVHKILIEGLLKLGILHNGTVEEILAARTSVAFLPHGLGHHMGMDTHDTGGHANYKDEDPLFRYLRVRIPLKERAVITVEPGCYFYEYIIRPYLKDPKHSKYINESELDKYWDVGGVRIEDDVLITKDGVENLTHTVKEIDQIEKMVDCDWE